MSSGLTGHEVIRLMNNGVRQTEIAKMYGVSRQYVNRLAIDAGHEPIVSQVDEHMPWEVEAQYKPSTLYQGLRLAAHYNLGGQGSLRGTSKDKVLALLRKLVSFRQVIDYDPSYTGVPGISSHPGFAYVPRTEQDEDFMIKIRPRVRITSLGDKIWRLPEEWPE